MGIKPCHKVLNSYHSKSLLIICEQARSIQTDIVGLLLQSDNIRERAVNGLTKKVLPIVTFIKNSRISLGTNP